MENRQEPNSVQEAAHSAAFAADNIHPSHWQPAKSDILSEQQLQAQADSLLYEQYGSESAARHGDVEAHFDGVNPVRAETPEEFTGIKFSSVKDYAGGRDAVASVAQHTLGEMGLVRNSRYSFDLIHAGYVLIH